MHKIESERERKLKRGAFGTFFYLFWSNCKSRNFFLRRGCADGGVSLAPSEKTPFLSNTAETKKQ
jgi:hypothetical protein